MIKEKFQNSKILVVDDNMDLLKAATILLKRYFERVDVESDPEQLPTLLANDNYDVILLDMNFTKDVSSGMEGYYWLDKILAIDPSAVVVLITAYGDVQTAVKVIKAGATDFVLKPWENEKLLATLYAALRLKESLDEMEDLKKKHKALSSSMKEIPEILGKSDAMLQIFSTIDRVASTDANILILGENGTGKELVARAIHNLSPRKDETVISVDLGSLTESLFESELFGHKKGAFTDAKEDRIGKFELANQGTLFLDEIGNLSLPLQAKLLAALQNRKVTAVGSNRAINVDIRLICATNMPLLEMIENKEFRQDLLYRINTIEITLPPLRNRAGDIPLLAEHFLLIYAKKYHKNIRKISDPALSRLEKHSWPGNVRELQHAVERAVILSTAKVLQSEDFNIQPSTKIEGAVMLDQLNLEDVEKLLIRKVLHKHNGNITRAANELGLTRPSFYRRLEKYGI